MKAIPPVVFQVINVCIEVPVPFYLYETARLYLYTLLPGLPRVQ